MSEQTEPLHVWEGFRALARKCADPDGDAEVARHFGIAVRWMHREALTRCDRFKAQSVQCHLSIAFASAMQGRVSAIDHTCFVEARRAFFKINFKPASPQGELFDGFKIEA